MENIEIILQFIHLFVTYCVPVIALILQIKSEKNYVNRLSKINHNTNTLKINLNQSLNNNNGTININMHQNNTTSEIQNYFNEKFQNKKNTFKHQIMPIIYVTNIVITILQYHLLNLDKLIKMIFIDMIKNLTLLTSIVILIYCLKPFVFTNKKIKNYLNIIILAIIYLIISFINNEHFINILESTFPTLRYFIYVLYGFVILFSSIKLTYYFIDHFYSIDNLN